MKKSLLALAVIGAFAGAAQAQVTVYGSFDGGLRYQTNVDAAGNNKLSLNSKGTYSSNRLGFRGVEDLGGGMNAHFKLETGWFTGTGELENTNNQLFNRSASVGLGGAWGSLDFGKQYSNAFETITSYEPFGYKYTGIVDTIAAATIPGGSSVRFNNDIKYVGTFGPVTARAEYAMGEQAGNTSAGSAQSIGATYTTGPITAGGAYTQSENTAGTLNNDHWTVGGAYKFGPARVAVGYANLEEEQATGADKKTRWAWVGANYAITPAVELTAAFYNTKRSGSQSGDKDNLMVGATYALSKRTYLYALVDSQKYEGALISTTTNQTRQRGVAVGLNHTF